MRELDGQARIFIGSSSEGRVAAETMASALAAAGMRPLLWSDFFKTPDLPLQELDRRMADADGAILVGSADDRLISREKEFDQMRDNVLFEYGLFAGHLGRHRCVLLMPDHPRFRIPSDFLGVAGFELYTDQTLNAVAKKVPERLRAGFAADEFKPPSLQERCRRLLLLSGWLRGEIAKIGLGLSRSSLKAQFGAKIEAILCFLKEDIDKLGLREDAALLEELVRKSFDNFPYVPDRGELEYQFKSDVRGFLSNPRGRLHRRFRYETGNMLGHEWGEIFEYAGHFSHCPWCSADRDCHRKGRFYRFLHGREDVPCAGDAWFTGAVDMLALLQRRLDELDHALSKLARWQRDWVPGILERLGSMEQTVHKQIFGHL